MNKSYWNVFLAIFLILLPSLLLFSIWLNVPYSQMIWVGHFSLLLSLVLTLLIHKFFLKPIDELQHLAHRISQGDFKGRVSLLRNDAIGGLAQQLNELSQDMQNKIAEISQDQNELKAILSSMVEGVLVINKDEHIVIMSPSAQEMLQLRSRDVLNKHFWEVIRHEEINSALEEALKEHKLLKKEITVLSPQENHFSLQVSCVFTASGELSAVVAVFHDITDLKKLARLRSEFVANVSHELKTPLTSIKGFVETLLDGALEDKIAAKKFLTIIQSHTQRLEYLVNDLLTLSALESKEPRLNFQQTSIQDILETVATLYKEQTKTRGQEFILNIPSDLPLISVDRLKIEQVFINLLDNAVKFTPTGGKIIVSANAVREGLQVDVKDSGVGISAQHLPRIFERFYRVDRDRSRELGGTGLGLAIVKHILQSHNGKITVQSEPEQGSTFSIFLPISPSQSS